jgi:hypothetical protein
MKTGGKAIEMTKGEIQHDPAIHSKGCKKINNVFDAVEQQRRIKHTVWTVSQYHYPQLQWDYLGVAWYCHLFVL